MLYFFRVLIILLKDLIPCFASVISMVWLVSAISSHFGRFGRFVWLFRVLVHARKRKLLE